MSELLKAMEFRMRKIVLEENRPFSVNDFVSFEVDGKEYSMVEGTFRNNMVWFRDNGIVELAFRSDKAYYTLKGKKFTERMVTSTNHEGVSTMSSSSSSSSMSLVHRQTPIYESLTDRPFESQSLHDIRLRFKAEGIWDTLHSVHTHDVIKDLNDVSKDIFLKPWKFYNDEDVEIKVTIHHSDTVSIAVACSYRPIAIHAEDLLFLFEILGRAEERLSNIVREIYDKKQRKAEQCCGGVGSARVIIPRITEWIVVMWHFGIDCADEYSGEKFNVTLGEGISDLSRIYTKRMKDGSIRRREELQEYPNKPPIEAVMDKLLEQEFLT
jgi:hypothetical protein